MVIGRVNKYTSVDIRCIFFLLNLRYSSNEFWIFLDICRNEFTVVVILLASLSCSFSSIWQISSIKESTTLLRNVLTIISWFWALLWIQTLIKTIHLLHNICCSSSWRSLDQCGVLNVLEIKNYSDQIYSLRTPLESWFWLRFVNSLNYCCTVVLYNLHKFRTSWLK